MSLELTENKPNIGSVALNDLVFILYCRVNRTVVADPSAISRRSVGEQPATDWRSVGDWLATVSWAFFIAESLQLFGDRSATDRRLVGDQSATKTMSGLSATAATGQRSVANQSVTCRQPVGDHQKPFYDRFGRREVSLAATKTSLRPNRPCNLLQPVADQSPTSLQPPGNLPATTRNLGRKEVADRLQALCDRGLKKQTSRPRIKKRLNEPFVECKI